MNCTEISRILDERGIAALSAAELADFRIHTARCPDCAAQSLVSRRLERFRAEVPPLPMALRERAEQLHEARTSVGRERRSRRPVLIGSLFLLGAAATMFSVEPWGDTSTANR